VHGVPEKRIPLNVRDSASSQKPSNYWTFASI
jgi:hypothetical protein